MRKNPLMDRDKYFCLINYQPDFSNTQKKENKNQNPDFIGRCKLSQMYGST